MNKKERIITLMLGLWVFLHVFLWILAIEEGCNGDYWYPFTSDSGYQLNGTPWEMSYFRLCYYDIKEFMVYAILPIIIFSSYIFVKKGKK